MEKKSLHRFAIPLLRFAACLIIPLILLFIPALSQEFGGNPPSVKWKQFNSDTARIIFPVGLDSQAREISGIIHLLAASTSSSLGNKIKKINIVLQNQSTQSNGYVGLGPFRSEFFLTARQNSFELGSLPWHKTLALHEYRHVQQFNNFRKGLSKVFYFVFGEEGQSFANSLAVPDWFWEGDAVHQETIMSNQGRGRIPWFANGYRSLWAADKNYKWMKLRNGSYRDYVPDHYQLGYLLVNHGYKKYGEEAYKNITSEAVAFKGLFYPFQSAFKRNSGTSFTNFTKEALSSSQAIAKTNSYDTTINFAKSNTHFVANELYPHWIDTTHIIYLKNSYQKISAFFTRNIITGKENRISIRSISTDEYFSYRNNRVVYSAYQPDARWGWKNYELIKILDIKTGKEKTLTKKSKYLSPDISENGKFVVAVNSPASGKNELHLLDAENGKLVNALPNPENYLFTYPKFYNTDSVIAAIRNDKGEMALASFSLADGKSSLLTPFSIRIIGFPQVSGDTIFFSMTSGTQDQLYAYSKGITRRFVPDLKNTLTGNYQLAGLNGHYAWSAFTAVGFHLMNSGGHFEEEKEQDKYPAPLAVGKLNLVTTPISSQKNPEKYSKNFRLLNFHSWRPYISDPEYSFSVVSENILNTLQSEVFFTYNGNEKFKETGALFSYGALYPIINAGASITLDRSFTDTAQVITWNETDARIGLRVPLNFTSGSFSQSISVLGTLNAKHVNYTGNSRKQFNNISFSYSDFIFSITNQQLKAKQNIYPRFAQTFSARVRNILTKYTGHQFLLNGAIYLPGLFTNHSFVVEMAYQHRDTLQQYTFSNAFPFSHGYPDIDFPRMFKAGFNYHFPLAYPDIGFGNIVYLLRLRSNLFYEYSQAKSLRSGLTYDFASAGAVLFFDTKWWNQLPVSFGIRYNRLLNADTFGISPNQWEIVLPVNLLSR